MRLIAIALFASGCATSRSVSRVPLSEEETRLAETVVGGGDVRLDPGSIELSHAHVDAATINGVRDGKTWSVDLGQVSSITALDRLAGGMRGAAVGAGIGVVLGPLLAIPVLSGSQCSSECAAGAAAAFAYSAAAGIILGTLLGAAIGAATPVEHRLIFAGSRSGESPKAIVASDSPRPAPTAPTIVLQPALTAPQETPASGVHWFAGGALGAVVDRSGSAFGGGFARSLDLSLAKERWSLHAAAIFATATQSVNDSPITAIYAAALYASRDLSSSPYAGLGAGYLEETGGASAVRESKHGASIAAECGWSFRRSQTILRIDLAATFVIPLYALPGSGPAAFPLATLMLRVML